MAQKPRFLISTILVPSPLPCQFLSLPPSTPPRKLLLLHSFRIHLFIWRRIPPSRRRVRRPPAGRVHFIFQIQQTFVIIHFLLLYVHSINVIYGADFALLLCWCVGLVGGKNRTAGFSKRKLHREDYDVVGSYQEWGLSRKPFHQQ